MYLRTDEEVDAAEAMSVAAEFAQRVIDDLHAWRWVIIALHSAAQGIMVLSLRHGNGLLALSGESATAWHAAYEADEVPPPDKLDNYLNLYKKVKHKELGCLGGNKRFIPAGTEGGDIKRLNSLRNEFVHFTPRGWSLEVDGLPRIVLATARMMSFLSIETENICWHRAEAKKRFTESHEAFVNAMRIADSAYKSK